MADRNLVVRALLGMTFTTAAALGIYWYYFNRRNKRAGDFINDQVPVQYPSDSNYHKSNSDNAVIKVPVTERNAKLIHEAVAGSTSDGHNGDGERSNGGLVTKPEDKQLTEEMMIPKDVVAGIIGKKGANIKAIQKESNSRINFKDETMENGDRICVIRGRPDDVAFAQDLIQKHIASQPVQITKEILVPRLCLGRIIGRNGETVRGIQDTSKAKVTIDSNREEIREGENETFGVIILKGTEEQIELAETLITEKVEEEKSFRNRIKGVASTRTHRRVNPSASPINAPAANEPSTVSLSPNGIIEVYVSCVYHPNRFWIQQVGQESIELDKLGEMMTDYYNREISRNSEGETEFEVGDIVAAPFSLDDKMYRAKIVKMLGDGKVEIEYVDYGDRRSIPANQLRTISPTFLSLKFQAVEASLNLGSDGEVWSDDAINAFCDLSYCAQWKAVTAKVKGFLSDEQGNKNRVVWLELMDKDLNIGQNLINQRLATSKDEFSQKLSDGSRHSSINGANSSSASNHHSQESS